MISQKLGEYHAAQSGNFYIGRQLWRTFQTVGFQNLDLEFITAHSDDLGVEAFLSQLDPNILIGMNKVGLLSDSELESIKLSREAIFNHPEAFILLNWFMVCGTKPTTE